MKEEKIITMQDMVNYCKQYGFIFQGSEIYDGLANTWDYGPLGSRLKNNIKDAWRKKFVQEIIRCFDWLFDYVCIVCGSDRSECIGRDIRVRCYDRI